LLVQIKVPKRKHARMAQTASALLEFGALAEPRTFPLCHPAPRKSPGRISLCARSAARMHVKCTRENPASPLCCDSVAAFLAATLTGFTSNACDARSRAMFEPERMCLSSAGEFVSRPIFLRSAGHRPPPLPSPASGGGE